MWGTHVSVRGFGMWFATFVFPHILACLLRLGRLWALYPSVVGWPHAIDRTGAPKAVKYQLSRERKCRERVADA